MLFSWHETSLFVALCTVKVLMPSPQELKEPRGFSMGPRGSFFLVGYVFKNKIIKLRSSTNLSHRLHFFCPEYLLPLSGPSEPSLAAFVVRLP